MELVKVEGIVVKETPYQNSSKILQILTKEYGMISVISKGCRNIKSKLRAVSNKLSLATFYLSFKKDSLSTLRDADNIIYLSNILSSITNITCASYLVDVSWQIVKTENNPSVFSLLKTALIKINDGLDPVAIIDIISLKFLFFLGVGINVNSCNLCGNCNNIETISVDCGGLVCSNCNKNNKIYSKKTIEIIRMFTLVDLDRITKLTISDEVKKEIEEFIELYYDKNTGIYLKSRQFLNDLNKVGK